MKLLPTIARFPRLLTVEGADGMGAVEIAHNRIGSWQCRRCDVRWTGEPTCWFCGATADN